MKIITSRSVLTLGALLLASSGCSFTFVHPRASSGQVAGARRACTSSKLAPILDTIFTGAQLARTAYALSASDSVYDDPAQPLSRGADVGLGVGLASLFLGSAIYGYVHTSECSKGRQGPSEATDDADLTPESWTTSPTRPKPAASAEQPGAPAAPPSSPASAAEPDPSAEPAESDAPTDTPPNPPVPSPPGATGT
jgi:hypothetical protein